MSRSVIAQVFLGGGILLVAGVLIAGASLSIGYANDVFVLDGRDIVGAKVAVAGYVMVALAAVGAVALVGGACAVLVAWTGALANVAAAARRGWFWLLVVLGALTFGWAALIAYLIGGPDRFAADRRGRVA